MLLRNFSCVDCVLIIPIFFFQAITVGLNVVREICLRMPLVYSKIVLKYVLGHLLTCLSLNLTLYTLFFALLSSVDD